MPGITFTSADFKGMGPEQDDPMVITNETLINQGSMTNILFWNTFKQLDIPESTLQPYGDLLFGFANERVGMKESIELLTRFDTKIGYRDIVVQYVVFHANTSYNILLGRPSINAIRVIISTPLLAMKFPFDKGSIITMYVDKKEARECYMTILKLTSIQEILKSQAINMVTLAGANKGETLDHGYQAICFGYFHDQ